jgi:hypothetical protein
MFEENCDATRLLVKASDSPPPWSARHASRESLVAPRFDGNRTVIAYAVRYQNGNAIVGRRLADQGGVVLHGASLNNPPTIPPSPRFRVDDATSAFG